VWSKRAAQNTDELRRRQLRPRRLGDERCRADQAERPRLVAVDVDMRPHVHARHEEQGTVERHLDPVKVREIDAKLLPLWIDAQLERQSAHEVVEAAGCNPPTGLADRLGQKRLQALPLAGEYGVPVSPVPPPPPRPKIQRLRAAVGPNGRATLSASSVKAGVYTVAVLDRSKRHNFRLAGRGVNKSTGAAFTGSATWCVRLVKGVYRFGSDARRVPGRLRVR
jgi:hypothetical protein